MADEKKIVKIPAQRTRAEFRADSFNEADRTVEVIFATETAVRTFDWESYEMVDEVLVCMPENGDLTRLNNGAPALDNHNRYGKTSDIVVGVVETARFENNAGIAKIRFGNTEDDTKLMEKVRDKIVTGVSVGYNVFEYQVTRKEGQKPLYRATKWEATEISFTPVQADINSRVRSEGEENTEATIIETVTENNSNESKENTMENEAPVTPGTPATPAAAPATVPGNADQTRAAATEERNRVLSIQSKVRMLGLPDTFANTLIEEGVSVDVASTRALQEWEKKQPANPVPTAEQVHTDAEKTRSAMADALVLRVDPNSIKVMEPERIRAAADFKGQTLLRFAEEALIRAGVRTAGMTPKTIATIALGGRVRGLHHTTDFPLLLMDTVNRTLLAQYALQNRTFEAWARRATISDFRPISRVRLSEILGDLEEVKEGAEYKYGTLSESGETYQLAKYGKIIGITWEAIINDDLSAFTRIPQAFAAKAAQLQSNLVYNTILSGGLTAMGDGKALFHADHGNYTGTAGNLATGGTALSEASLTLAYQLFMKQTGPDGSFITVQPKFLIVGPKNAFLAMKMTSANYTANTQANVPVGALVGLTVIVEPRITNYEWFLIADPAMIDTVEYAFLAGEEELFIDQREGFNIDGIEVKARMVFAAKPIDWRGMYRNNGAAPA
jgi:hypothetical protein